jgi:AmmeMemoRadiSam system protein A
MNDPDEPCVLADADRAAIMSLALDSIHHGIRHGRAAAVREIASPRLLAPGACFVSLHMGDQLRGCVGQTVATRPLAEQVVEYAWAAAFRDPRFDPLTPAELDALSVEVHVLSPLEPLVFADLSALHALLRPGRDGLQLEARESRAVFLPVMWKQLPTAVQFVAQLLRKGGMSGIPPLAASRFGAEIVSREA